MVDQINTLPWEGFAYKITDRPCIHFKDERHMGDCSVCVRSVLLEVAEKARQEEREHCIRLIEAPIKGLKALMTMGDEGGLIGAHIQALEESSRAVRESGEFADALRRKKEESGEKR